MAISSLLDRPAILEQALRFSVEQYHLFGEAGLIPERVELLDGVIVEKMSKSPLHVFTTEEFMARLRAVAKEGWLVRQEQPITCRHSEPEPDVAVVWGTRADYLYVHPTTAKLVVEIAISSGEIDAEKAAIYAEAQVSEYWIVFPEDKRIEVYTAPLGRQYAQRRSVVCPEVAVSQALPDFRLDLGTFFPA